MAFRTSSGFRAPVRPRKRKQTSEVGSGKTVDPKSQALASFRKFESKNRPPTTTLKSRAEAVVSREFPRIIANELPRGFTGGANITRPHIVQSLAGTKRGETKPTAKVIKRFGRDVEPRTRLVAGRVTGPKGLRLIRHEIGHQVLGQQGVPDAVSEDIVTATKVAPPAQQLRQLPAARLFFTATGANRAGGFRSLLEAGGRKALLKKK